MIITQTPLRISLLGGGTDFKDFYSKHGGCVLTTSIDKYVYCIIKGRFDDKTYVNYSSKEIVDSVDQLEHELVRESMRKVEVKGKVEISFLSDLPDGGSGLGSSSTFTVGALNALYHFVGHVPSAEQLAKEACEIEIVALNKPIGIQDQYIASYGGLRFMRFGKNSKVAVSRIAVSDHVLEDLDNYLMLFYTGITRKSETILHEQVENIKSKEKILLQLAALADEGRKCLEMGRVSQLGKLLHQSWLLKKQLASKITNTKIDDLYDRAIKAGALGGKISGAGGGGFFTLFVPTEKRSAVRHALKSLREVPFRLSRDGSKVIFNSGV